MEFKTILVPTEQHDLMNSTLETALLLARKFDSYIEGFALRVVIPTAYAMADAGPVAIPPSLEQDIAENAKQTRSLFKTFMQEHGLPCGGPTTALSSKWLEDAPEGDHFVGSHGRLFDVIVLGRPGRDLKGSRATTLEAALFESGRPVLIAPPSPRAQMGQCLDCMELQHLAGAHHRLRDADSQAGQPYRRIDGGRRSSSTRTNGSATVPLFAIERGPGKTINRRPQRPRYR